MATIAQTKPEKSGQHIVVKLAAMGHNDVSDTIIGAYYDHAWFLAEAGAGNVNPTTSASLQVRAVSPTSTGASLIAEDVQKNTHLRLSISSAGAVTAGRLRGPLPTKFEVTLNGAAAAGWDVYVVLQKSPTYDRGS